MSDQTDIYSGTLLPYKYVLFERCSKKMFLLVKFSRRKKMFDNFIFLLVKIQGEYFSLNLSNKRYFSGSIKPP